MAQKLTAEQAQARFPGFIVNDGDFEIEANKVYRVNANGLRIDVSKGWSFSERDGEFYRAGKKVGSYVPTVTFPHRQRVVAFVNSVNREKYDGLPAVVGGGLLVGVLAVLCFLQGSTDWGIGLGLLFLVFVWGLNAKLRPNLQKIEAKIVGPEPLKRKTEDFGPASATTTAQHPAADDLAY